MKSNAMRFLSQKAKGQKLNIVVLVILNAILSVLSIFFALGIKKVIDIATSTGENLKDSLIYASIAVTAIIIFQFILKISVNLLTEKTKAKLEISYKTHLFSSILAKKYDKITKYHSGELMNRLTSDVSVCSVGVAEIIPDAIGSATKIISALATLLILSPLFCLILMGAGLVVFLTVFLVKNSLKSLHKKSQETDGLVRSYMQEGIENLLAIKAFSVNDKVKDDADRLQQKNYKVKMRRRNVAVAGNAVYNVIFSLGYVFAVIYGGFMILKGDLFFGTLSAILQLVMNIQAPFASLSLVIPRITSTLASAERIMEIDDIQDEVAVKPIDQAMLNENMDSIEFKNVSFGYNDQLVLDDINLSVKKGEFVAITGRSGIGKSTLIKLLLGVYPASKGQINIEGENLVQPVGVDTRNLFAFVPQGNLIFSGTLRENITFINTSATEEQISYAIENSCLMQVINELPEGLETRIGENGIGLSEGQIQRLAIARALLTGAKVLLLDESTSALDSATEQKVLANLKQIPGLTALLITHKQAGLEICDRTIRIENKKVIEEKLQ